MDMIQKISALGIVPVIKLTNPDNAVPLCRALARGGLPVAEITFRTAAAEESIRRVAHDLPEILVGAGTVLSVEQLNAAAQAGADYVVAPGFNKKVVARAQELGLPIVAGCVTPTEIEAGL